MTTSDEMNAMALAANIASMRDEYERRLTHVENKLTTVESLLTSQNRVLNEALQMAYGKGSTVPES